MTEDSRERAQHAAAGGLTEFVQIIQRVESRYEDPSLTFRDRAVAEIQLGIARELEGALERAYRAAGQELRGS